MSDKLPEGWTRVPFSDMITELRNGISTRPSLEPPGTPILRTSAARPGSVVLEDRRFLPNGESLLDTYRLRDGDLVFTRYNGSLDLLGVCGMVRALGEAPLLYPDKLMRARVRESLVLPEYVERFFQSPGARDALVGMAKSSAGQQGISGGDLKAQAVLLAPLPEQHRIVARVEALFADVTKAKERLDRVPLILKRFRQAVLAAACSGELTKEWRDEHPDAARPTLREPSREGRRGRRGANLSGDGILLIDEELPELPDTWMYARLDRLTEPGTVITYGIVLPGPEVDGGVPYVRGQDVEDGRLRTNALRHTTKEIASKHERSTLLEGDVLLCIIRNLRVAIVPKGLDGANITQGMVRIRPSLAVVLRDFIAYYLMSPLAQGWMKKRYFGMDMPRINVEDARAIPVTLPPIDEQAEIVRQIQKLFALADAIERRLKTATARAERLPQAILTKAFSGELVPTEAELARAEGRGYETATELLARVRKGSEAAAEPKRAKPLVARRRRKVAEEEG